MNANDDEVPDVLASATGYSIEVRNLLADAILTALCDAQGQGRDDSGQDRRMRSVESIDALMMVAAALAYVGPPLATFEGIAEFCSEQAGALCEHVQTLQGTALANGMPPQDTRLLRAIINRVVPLHDVLHPNGDGNPPPEACTTGATNADLPPHLKRKLN